jgi:hypothetical protein
MPLGDHLALTIGFFTGILPAVIIVMYTLKDYDEYYKYENFFILLVLGLVAGVPSALIYYWTIIYLASVMAILAFIAMFIIIAVYEFLLLTIILSMKRFGAKYDLTYYGVTLSGTISGVIVMFSIYLFFRSIDLTAQAILSMAFFIPTMPMIYITIGAMTGFGIFRGEFFKYGLRVVIIKTIFNVLLVFWFIAFLFWVERGWEWMAIGLVIGIIGYYYTVKDLLPAALPKKLQKHRRRARRKARIGA